MSRLTPLDTNIVQMYVLLDREQFEFVTATVCWTDIIERKADTFFLLTFASLNQLSLHRNVASLLSLKMLWQDSLQSVVSTVMSTFVYLTILNT